MKSTPKPTSRFIYFTIILLLSLTFIINSIANEEDSDDIEDLIALDQEEEQQQSDDGTHHSKPLTEAEVLTKAQRIVLELNSDNTQKAIYGNEYVLILGYAPWCVRSAELMPRFAEAATSLNELKIAILMAKIDAERYPKVASNLGIKGYPTLLLFINATSQPYTGGFSSEEMVIWARKKTGTPVIGIESVDEANDFIKKHSMFAVGLFDKFKGPDYEEFVKAATTDNEIQFVETNSHQIADILFPDVIKSTNSFLGIVKSEPERYTSYEDAFTKDGILEFLNDNKFPLVTFLTEVNSAKVYASDKLQIYVFAEADEFKKLLEPFQDAAKKFKSKIMFVFIDIKDDNLAKPFLTLFGLEESEDTLVTAFDYKSGAKYLLESDPTPKRIEEFCSRLLKGILPPFYKSQAIPHNKGADILTVVGKTFEDLILRSSKNIILEIHTPWCMGCETTSKQVEKLAKHFKGLENVVFAKIDASVNEHPKLEVDDFPTLLFYPGSNKSNPIKMPTKSSAKDLAILINKYLKAEAEAQYEKHMPKDEL